MQLTRRSPSLAISAANSRPHALFHYSERPSCIVTTTNFLAVYKAVNQNHSEQGVEVGGCRGGAGWAVGDGCRAPDQMSEFNIATPIIGREGEDGGREGRTEVKSCLPVCT